MRKQQTLDPNNPAEFTLTTPELGNFTVTGYVQDIEPVYEQAQATLNSLSAVKQPKSNIVAHAAVEAVVEPLNGLRADVTAIVYDWKNNTAFHKALREQRQLRKDVRMAQLLGLVTIDKCQKHPAGVDKVKALR